MASSPLTPFVESLSSHMAARTERWRNKSSAPITPKIVSPNRVELNRSQTIASGGRVMLQFTIVRSEPNGDEPSEEVLVGSYLGYLSTDADREQFVKVHAAGLGSVTGRVVCIDQKAGDAPRRMFVSLSVPRPSLIIPADRDQFIQQAGDLMCSVEAALGCDAPA